MRAGESELAIQPPKYLTGTHDFLLNDHFPVTWYHLLGRLVTHPIDTLQPTNMAVLVAPPAVAFSMYHFRPHPTPAKELLT